MTAQAKSIMDAAQKAMNVFFAWAKRNGTLLGVFAVLSYQMATSTSRIVYAKVSGTLDTIEVIRLIARQNQRDFSAHLADGVEMKRRKEIDEEKQNRDIRKCFMCLNRLGCNIEEN